MHVCFVRASLRHTSVNYTLVVTHVKDHLSHGRYADAKQVAKKGLQAVPKSERLLAMYQVSVHFPRILSHNVLHWYSPSHSHSHHFPSCPIHSHRRPSTDRRPQTCIHRHPDIDRHPDMRSTLLHPWLLQAVPFLEDAEAIPPQNTVHTKKLISCIHLVHSCVRLPFSGIAQAH